VSTKASKIPLLSPASFASRDGKRLTPSAYVFLILLCIAFFIPGFATLPPTDRDESSFAQASKQMIETGNYVDIRLKDKPRYKKPIGIYWLQSASVQLFNSQHLNEIWAYRIPSFVGATVAVVMTAALGSLLFGPMAGLLAAMMMAGCAVLNVEARLAKTDAALLGSIMVMQYALARAYLNKDMKWTVAAAFWTALAVGILLKGPIILLVLFSTLAWLRLSHKNIKWFKSLMPLVGIPYLLILVMPWFIAIALQSQGAFIEQSAGQDMLAKIWHGQNRGILLPGLHLLAFLAVFFPFSLFALLAIPDTLKNYKKPAVQFCLGWIVPTWIIFELSLTKLPHYTMPLYPAIALLSAKALLDGYPVLAEKDRRWWVALVIGLWTMLGTAGTLGFILLPLLTEQVWNIPQIIAGAILILTQGACLFLLFQRKTSSVVVMTLGSLIFITCTIGITLPNLDHLWISRQAVQMAEKLSPCDDLHIVSAAYNEPSLIFLAGTDTVITVDGATAADELKQNPCAVALIDAERKPTFLSAFSIAEAHPVPMGKIEGLNSGHGKSSELTVYLLPHKPMQP